MIVVGGAGDRIVALHRRPTGGVEAERQILAGFVPEDRSDSVSQNHLMKIVSDLVSIGYVESVRGRNGGIRLGRAPSEINVGALIRHTEDDFDLVGCGACVISTACGLTGVLDVLVAFMAVLDRYTLADVLARKGDFSHLLFGFEPSPSLASGHA